METTTAQRKGTPAHEVACEAKHAGAHPRTQDIPREPRQQDEGFEANLHNIVKPCQKVGSRATRGGEGVHVGAGLNIVEHSHRRQWVKTIDAEELSFFEVSNVFELYTPSNT